MAVLRNETGTELLVDCNCGCDTGIRLRIDKDDDELYCFMTYTNGEFYRAQGDTAWHIFRKKLKKIWAIIRNKDFYYNEFVMTKGEFNMFRDYLASVDKED